MKKKKYQIIYADPPWPIKWTGSAGIGKKPLMYPTMPITKIGLLPVKSISEDGSKLFLWTTNGFLEEALGIVQMWGFHYDKLWTWCKPTGAGGHPRNATEHLIEATRGNLKKSLSFHDKATNNWFIASTQGHSKKPKEIREFIEKCYPKSSKIELFARQKNEGWDIWGNKLENDIELTNLIEKE